MVFTPRSVMKERMLAREIRDIRMKKARLSFDGITSKDKKMIKKLNKREKMLMMNLRKLSNERRKTLSKPVRIAGKQTRGKTPKGKPKNLIRAGQRLLR